MRKIVLSAQRRARFRAQKTAKQALEPDRTNKLIRPLQREPHPVGVGLGFGSVWVAVLDSANVDRIDPRTGRVIAWLPVGGKPIVLAVGFGAVWVNDDDGRVLRIEPQG
jgi:hypothetical protein